MDIDTPAKIVLSGGVGLVLLSLLSPAAAGSGAVSPMVVMWSDAIETPAICIGRPEWFVSVVPGEIDLESLSAPTLARDDTRRACEIRFLGRQRRLCLLEIEQPIEKMEPVPIASTPGPGAGERLHCRRDSTTCQTTVAGRDCLYRGESLSHPMLRVRIAEASRFCRPGAPLVNDRGELAGILTDRELATPGEVHAIPAAQLRKLIRDVERFDRSGPVWVGLVFHDRSSTPEVIEVRDGSPAAEAGILAGDVVMAVNATEVEDLKDLIGAIHGLPAGEEAEFAVLRGLEKRTLSVVPRFAAKSAAEK